MEQPILPLFRQGESRHFAGGFQRQTAQQRRLAEPLHRETFSEVGEARHDDANRSDNRAIIRVAQKDVAGMGVEFVGLLSVLSRFVAALDTVYLVAKLKYFTELARSINYLD